MNNSKNSIRATLHTRPPATSAVRPNFPECANYEVRNDIDWRNDRYSIHTEHECVVSGLSAFQTLSLMSHFKFLEEKAK